MGHYLLAIYMLQILFPHQILHIHATQLVLLISYIFAALLKISAGVIREGG